MTAALAPPLDDTPTVPVALAAPPALAKPRLVLAVRTAPRREPPFDDELAEPLHRGRYEQRLPLPRAERREFEPVALDPTLPDPSRWARTLLVGVAEVAGGRRALQQLGAMFSFGVSHGLGRDLDRVSMLGRKHWTAASTVRSVRAAQPVEGVAEVSATLQCGERIRAVAMRLERQQGRWKCTRLQLG
ncbi:MAG TPA: Rv3235 family protein [Jatrophihabitans sp.]|jgi:hypothetical protein